MTLKRKILESLAIILFFTGLAAFYIILPSKGY